MSSNGWHADVDVEGLRPAPAPADELRDQIALLQAEKGELRARNATAVHDARGRLTNLAGFAQLLVQREGSRLDETSQRYLAQMLRAMGDIRGLFDRLLDDVREPWSRPVVLADVVHDVANTLDLRIQGEGARLVIDIEALAVVPGDRRQLERLFSNLVGNALKHRHPDRPLTVHISATESSGGWEVAVEDNGTGIPLEAQARIFDMYEQAMPTDHGCGIGLAICRTVAEDHGGHVHAEEIPGGGTRFVVFLPLTRES